MCEDLGLSLPDLFMLKKRDSHNTKESNKLLWRRFLVLHKSGGATTGETDCRLFCVQRGNGGRLVVAFRLMYLPPLRNAFESATAM